MAILGSGLLTRRGRYVPKHAASVGVDKSTGWKLEAVRCDNPRDRLWREAERLEAGVFVEKGYVRSRRQLRREYLAYEAASSMMVLVLNKGEGGRRSKPEIIGAARLIHPREGTGLKTLNDIRSGRLSASESGQATIDALDLSRTIEIGTIALKPEYRAAQGSKSVRVLYSAIIEYGLRAGMTGAVASFDEGYGEGFLSGSLGSAAVKLGPATEYMGSPTIPVYLDGVAAFESMLTPREATPPSTVTST